MLHPSIGSNSIVKQVFRKYKDEGLRVIRFKKNQGKGMGVKVGFSEGCDFHRPITYLIYVIDLGELNRTQR